MALAGIRTGWSFLTCTPDKRARIGEDTRVIEGERRQAVERKPLSIVGVVAGA